MGDLVTFVRCKPRATAPIVLLVVGLLVTACTGERSSTAPVASGSPADGGSGAASLDDFSARIPGSSTRVGINRVSVPGGAQDQLADLHERFGVRWSVPLEVHADGALPASGAVLTKTYPTPLAGGAEVAFAYLDDNVGGWRVVPSVLSPDRRTLTATVHHFSAWTDFVSEANNKVGEFFDIRVSKPTCVGPEPEWVDSTTFLDDRNSALLWCFGRDPAHAAWLVVKVRVNRGYGVAITTDTQPRWTWNSFLDRDALDLTGALLTDYQKTVSQYLTYFANGSQVVPGGAEIDLGFTEDQVRAARHRGLALVQAAKPDLTELVISLAIRQLADLVDDRTAAYVLGVLTGIHCAAAIVKAGRNWSRLSGAVTDCVVDAQDVIAKELSGQLAARYPALTPKEAAAKAVGYTRKLKLIAAAGILFQAAGYFGDVTLPDAARTFNVFPRVVKRATKKIVLTPVRADSTPAADYTVRDLTELVDCSPPNPSPVSLAHGVYSCSPSAADADVCWPDVSPQHVLCLYTPWERTLVRLPTAAPLSPVPVTDEPAPLGLELSDGDRCRIRNGGAWGQPEDHPDYVGYYSCTKHQAVWGSTTGIDNTSPTWTVQVGGETGPLLTRTVLKAYYVATA